MSEPALLLDSQVWLWLIAGDPKLGARAFASIHAQAKRQAVAVSDVSFWEVALKAAKRKLKLLPDVEEWLSRSSKTPGIGVIALNRDLMVRSTLLDWSHADPADRMLVTTAMYYGLELVTADRVILDYANNSRSLRVIDATR